LLTIQNDKLKLERQLSEIQEKSKDDRQIVYAKLLEKDNELQALKKQMFSIQQSQKETQKQLEELLKKYRSQYSVLMRTI
jgi:predicted  nucleic acid-binding Zn-ribbon protein